MIATTQNATTRTWHALIVDDSDSDTELAAVHLQRAHPGDSTLTVVRAADGEAALAKLDQEHFTLLILDWQMPRIGGAEVLRHLRNSGSHTAVVVLSGLNRNEIKENLESLAAVYLNKNEMNTETLQSAIALALKLLD